MAFSNAAVSAFQDGLRQGKTPLLEPIFRIEVLTPVTYTDAVLGQLTSRRTEIQGTELRPSEV